MQLYDQFNRPIAPLKKPESRPLPVAPIMDSWRQYVANGLTPEKLAAILKEADAGNVGRQSQLFDQIEEKDGHLLGEKSKRQNIILDVDFKLEPASEDNRDLKVAEFVEDTFANISDWDDVLVSMQDAVGKGFAALEIDWDISSGQATPHNFDFIEQKRFIFTDEKGYLRQTPLLLTDDNLMGIEVPAWKMLFHRYGGKSGHPTRSGILRVAAWMHLFKNYAIKDWVVFCEIYGMPLRLGKYDTGANKEDKEALVSAIRSLGSDAAGIISKSTEIEFIETINASAKGDLWKMLASFCNAEMSKAILGQTLSAEVGDKGSYAAAKVHDGVRVDLLRADGRAIASTIRYQIIRPLVGFNFGWDTAVPKYKGVWEEQEDLNQKAEWVGTLLDRGVKMPVSFINHEFSIPEAEDGEEMVGATADKDSEVKTEVKKEVAKLLVAAHSEQFTPEQQAIEDLADLGIAQAADEYNQNEALILKIVQESASYEEAMDKLLDIYPRVETGQVASLLEQCLFSGTMFGAHTVTDNES